MKNRRIALIMALALGIAVTASGCGAKKSTEPAPQDKAVSEASAEAADEAEKSEEKAAEAGEKEEAKIKGEKEVKKSPDTSSKKDDPRDQKVLDETVTAHFVSDPNFDYNLDYYGSLAKKGDMSEADYEHFKEFADDVVSFDFQAAGIPVESIYGPCTMQAIIKEGEDDITRIVWAETMTGDEKMDAIMKKVGYDDYEVTYFYTHGIYEDTEEDYSKPVFAILVIGDNQYEYYFWQDRLVKRFGPDGESFNPETNDFMNDVYRLGCYYGEVLNKEKNVYDLMIQSPKSYEVYDDHIVINCNASEREGEYAFVIDKDTTFAPDCEMSFFEDYKDGETPLEWFGEIYKAYNDSDDADKGITQMPLLGIFDVKATGTHVDSIRGTYWWD